MKKDRKPNRHELKKAREFRNFIITLLVIVLAAFGVYFWPTNQKFTIAPAQEEEIESYIRSKTSETAISLGREPVALYYKRPDMLEEKFCCIGTVQADREYGMVVITAEHVFRTDIHAEQQISFRPLRKAVKEPIYYFDRIVKTSSEFGGQDAVMATFGDHPRSFPRFSKFVFGEVSKHFYGDVEVGTKKVPWIQSLVSGEKIPTIGYGRRGDSTNDPVFIIIECASRPGESGTGFIDEYGGLWVLHASPEPGQEELMRDEYERLMHKKIKAFSMVSGPFGGNYK